MKSAKRQYTAPRLKLVPNELKPARLTNAQAAHYLGITPETLTNWRYHGKGPRFSRDGKIHSPVDYRPHDLDEYIDSRMIE